MRIASIHQPSYWPWLGLLDKIAKTNIFILFDDAQVVKGTYQYRNIFFCNGEEKFLTLPIDLKLGMTFNDLRFKRSNWEIDHLNKLNEYYKKAPYFEEVYHKLEDFYSIKYDKPIDFLRSSIDYCFEIFEINVEYYLSSDFNVLGRNALKVLNLCKSANVEQYLAGRGSFEYMQESLPDFEKNNIEVIWHKFIHPEYLQSKKYDFLPGLSCLDLLFFCGVDNSRKIFWDNLDKTK